jgi:hypothetical protein
MIWGKNKSGDRIGIVNWTLEGISQMSVLKLAAAVRKAAVECRYNGARSCVIIIETNPKEDIERWSNST